MAGFPRTCAECNTNFRVQSRSQPGKWCSLKCRREWQKRNPNMKWQLAGQAKMRARFAAMTVTEKYQYCMVERNNIPKLTPEIRRKLSVTKLGNLNPMKRPEVALKVSQTIKMKHGKTSSERFKQMWKAGRLGPHISGPRNVSPNKMETRFAEILFSVLPLFRYVGDGAFWIGPCKSGKRRNPDFIFKQERKVILFHGEYWHPEGKDIQEQDYLSRNWMPLTVWSKELHTSNRATLIQKLISFGQLSAPSGSLGAVWSAI